MNSEYCWPRPERSEILPHYVSSLTKEWELTTFTELYWAFTLKSIKSLNSLPVYTFFSCNCKACPRLLLVNWVFNGLSWVGIALLAISSHCFKTDFSCVYNKNNIIKDRKNLHESCFHRLSYNTNIIQFVLMRAEPGQMFQVMVYL